MDPSSEPLDYDVDPPPPLAIDVNFLAERSRVCVFNLLDCTEISCVLVGQDFCGVMKRPTRPPLWGCGHS
jgi:hypothetical protein